MLAIQGREAKLAGRGSLRMDDAEVERRYLAGESGEAIAQSLGTSKHTIYRRLAARGAVLRPAGRVRLCLDEESIVALYRRDTTVSAIARRCGCHRPTIVRILRKAGVYERNSRPGGLPTP